MLSTRLMNSWVVRVLGPAVAKVTKPRVFDSLTASSGMFASFQALLTAGSPLIPNWTMNPFTVRKKRTPS